MQEVFHQPPAGQDGVWVAVVPGDVIPDYRLNVTYGEETTRVDDPYSDRKSVV